MHPFYRRNSDEQLRNLERQAASGNMAARKKLHHYQDRLGLPEDFHLAGRNYQKAISALAQTEWDEGMGAYLGERYIFERGPGRWIEPSASRLNLQSSEAIVRVLETLNELLMSAEHYGREPLDALNREYAESFDEHVAAVCIIKSKQNRQAHRDYDQQIRETTQEERTAALDGPYLVPSGSHSYYPYGAPQRGKREAKHHNEPNIGGNRGVPEPDASEIETHLNYHWAGDGLKIKRTKVRGKNLLGTNNFRLFIKQRPKNAGHVAHFLAIRPLRRHNPFRHNPTPDNPPSEDSRLRILQRQALAGDYSAYLKLCNALRRLGVNSTITRFNDGHSGGGTKTPHEHIWIEAPEEIAAEIFRLRLGMSPYGTACSCCGPNFSIDEHDDLWQATAYERNCGFSEEEDRYIEEPDTKYAFRGRYRTLEEFLRHLDGNPEDGLIIMRGDFTLEEARLALQDPLFGQF
jgi:hypothetical protein